MLKRDVIVQLNPFEFENIVPLRRLSFHFSDREFATLCGMVKLYSDFVYDDVLVRVRVTKEEADHLYQLLEKGKGDSGVVTITRLEFWALTGAVFYVEEEYECFCYDDDAMRPAIEEALIAEIYRKVSGMSYALCDLIVPREIP